MTNRQTIVLKVYAFRKWLSFRDARHAGRGVGGGACADAGRTGREPADRLAGILMLSVRRSPNAWRASILQAVRRALPSIRFAPAGRGC